MKKVFIKAIPNPIQNKLVLEAKNFASGIVQVQVVDSKGLLVYNDKRLVVLDKDNISIYMPFKPGTHWAIVKQDNTIAKCSFMVLP